MNPSQILVKTEKGRDEIKSRALSLSQHARNLLIAIDGHRSSGELIQLYSKIPDAAAVLRELVDLGLADTPENAAKQPPALAPKLRQAMQAATEAVNAHVGFGGFTLTLRIGRCRNVDELRALMPEVEAAIAKKRGAETAQSVTASLVQILA